MKHLLDPIAYAKKEMTRGEDWARVFEQLDVREIPEKYPIAEDAPDNISPRDIITRRYEMWALVDNQWPKIIADHLHKIGGTALEIMAGGGWLAQVLASMDTCITATDIAPKGPNVEQMEAMAAVERYGPDVAALIVSWPPYEDEIAIKCVREFIRLNPSAPIFYIGEGPWGCCADDTFFEQTEIVEEHSIPRWPHIHDSLYQLEVPNYAD